MNNDDIIILPIDYEPCGQCGFDHSYEQEEAIRWHRANDLRETEQLQEYPPEVLNKIYG